MSNTENRKEQRSLVTMGKKAQRKIVDSHHQHTTADNTDTYPDVNLVCIAEHGLKPKEKEQQPYKRYGEKNIKNDFQHIK